MKKKLEEARQTEPRPFDTTDWLRAAVKMIEQIQWGANNQCPLCRNRGRHRPDCKLVAFLRSVNIAVPL